MNLSHSCQTGRRARTFVPRLEALEDRQLLSCTVTEDPGILKITGDDGINNIEITDNGSDSAGNVTVLCDGVSRTSSTAIRQIIVKTKKGNDTINYSVTGTFSLRAPRFFTVDLGKGNDTFNLNFASGVAHHLSWDVKGGDGQDAVNATLGNVRNRALVNGIFKGQDGNDSYSVNLAGDLRTGADVRFDFNGGDDSDVLNFNAASDSDIEGDCQLSVKLRKAALHLNYQGELDGVFLLDASGGGGKDVLAADLTLDPGSTGRVGADGQPASVRGDSDKDNLRFVVHNNGTARVFARVDGGSGKDVCTRTTNVTPRRCDNADDVVP